MGARPAAEKQCASAAESNARCRVPSSKSCPGPCNQSKVRAHGKAPVFMTSFVTAPFSHRGRGSRVAGTGCGVEVRLAKETDAACRNAENPELQQGPNEPKAGAAHRKLGTRGRVRPRRAKLLREEQQFLCHCEAGGNQKETEPPQGGKAGLTAGGAPGCPAVGEARGAKLTRTYPAQRNPQPRQA